VSVTKDRPAQSAEISCSTHSGNGYLVLQAKKLDTTVSHGDELKDSVPEFALVNAPSFGSYGQQADVVRHPTHKCSASRVYDRKKTTRIIAVNDGKPDANARFEPYHNGSAGSQFRVAAAGLAKKTEWPCDDDVDAQLTFTLDFETV